MRYSTGKVYDNNWLHKLSNSAKNKCYCHDEDRSDERNFYEY